MRKIIHIDMDAFFASVEQRDYPEWRNKPIAVGGKPNARGVVATASYEARKYGIRSAMPMAKAVKLCPQLIVVPPRIAVYRQIATVIREIFARFTDKIEPLSIDEAYLDVSDSDDFRGSATLMAHFILKTIREETALSASAGVSYCKFLAKYASNIDKPGGVTTIKPEDAQAIVDAMPVEKMHGIGPATQKKLNAMGIYTGLDLRSSHLGQLQRQLGKTATFYYQLAHGRDEREIRTSRERKSLGNETTFDRDIVEWDELWGRLQQILHKTWAELSRRELSALTITVKIKYDDFSLQTKRHSEKTAIASLAVAELISQALLRAIAPQRRVRLIGVTFSQLVPKTNLPTQLRLFD